MHSLLGRGQSVKPVPALPLPGAARTSSPWHARVAIAAESAAGSCFYRPALPYSLPRSMPTLRLQESDKSFLLEVVVGGQRFRNTTMLHQHETRGIA